MTEGLWYIPHHRVDHPKKPDKVRIVFDCSSSYAGVSLNGRLLQGSNLANNLLGVIMRFYEQLAILADMEAMFHQVKVPPYDRGCLRLCRWSDENFEKEPIIYRMTTYIWGNIFVKFFALKRTVVDFSEQFDSKVADTIYVENCLSSISSDSQAISLIEDVTALC